MKAPSIDGTRSLDFILVSFAAVELPERDFDSAIAWRVHDDVGAGGSDAAG
jgi:hypothetical protein